MTDSAAPMANEREEHFLRSRGVRAEQRAALAVDDTAARARAAFLELVARRQAAIAAILAEPVDGTATGAEDPAPGRPSAAAAGAAGAADPTAAAARAARVQRRTERALAEWRLLQSDVRDGNDTVGLTAHEVRAANAALIRGMADVDAAVAAADPRPRFAFSAAVATVDLTAATAAELTGCVAANAAVEDLADAADAGPGSGDNVLIGLRGGGGATHAPPGLRALFVRKSEGAVVLALPVAGSVFVSDCHGCTVYAACHQLRVKNCFDCSFYVWARTAPVIESSDALRFGPYDAWRWAVAATAIPASGAGPPPGGSGAAAVLEALAVAAGIADVGHARLTHRSVDDFSWLKQQASPHWTVVAAADYDICDEPPLRLTDAP